MITTKELNAIAWQGTALAPVPEEMERSEQVRRIAECVHVALRSIDRENKAWQMMALQLLSTTVAVKIAMEHADDKRIAESAGLTESEVCKL